MRQRPFKSGMSLVEILISLCLAAMVILATAKLSGHAQRAFTGATNTMTEGNLLTLSFATLMRDLQGASIMQARRVVPTVAELNRKDPLVCSYNQIGAFTLLNQRPSLETTLSVELRLRQTDLDNASARSSTLTFLASGVSAVGKLVLNSAGEPQAVIVTDGAKFAAGDLVMISGRKSNEQSAAFLQVDHVDGNKLTVRGKDSFKFAAESDNVMAACSYNYSYPRAALEAMGEGLLRVDRVQQVQYYLEPRQGKAVLKRKFWRNPADRGAEQVVAENVVQVKLAQTWRPLAYSAAKMVLDEKSVAQEIPNSSLGTSTFDVHVVAASTLGSGEEQVERAFDGQTAYSFTSSGRINYDLLLEGFNYDVASPLLSFVDNPDSKSQEDLDTICQGDDKANLYQGIRLRFSALETGSLSNKRLSLTFRSNNPNKLQVRCQHLNASFGTEETPKSFSAMGKIAGSFSASGASSSMNIFCCALVTGLAEWGSDKFVDVAFTGDISGSAQYSYQSRQDQEKERNKKGAKFSGKSWSLNHVVAVEIPNFAPTNNELSDVGNDRGRALKAKLNLLQDNIRDELEKCSLTPDLDLTNVAKSENSSSRLTKVAAKTCVWTCSSAVESVPASCASLSSNEFSCDCRQSTARQLEVSGCTKKEVSYYPGAMLRQLKDATVSGVTIKWPIIGNDSDYSDYKVSCNTFGSTGGGPL